MANFLASAVHIIEEKPQVRTLAQPPSAIPGVVGLTERGPLDTPTTVSSWDEYVQNFGGLLSGAEVPMNMRMFFQNGGGSAEIVRVLGTLSAAVTSGNAETYALSDGEVLTLKVDGGVEQTATFNTADFVAIGAATAAEVFAVINTDITGVTANESPSTYVTITSDTATAASRIEITSNTDATALGFTVGATGITAAKDLVDGSSVDTLKISANSAGAWGNNISYTITDATNGVAENFNLTILKSGEIVEVWPNLSMVDANTNFCETVVNNATTGSLYVTLTDLDSVTATPGDRPANVTTATALIGGGNGATPTDASYTGGVTSTLGLNTLEEENITLLAIPDSTAETVQEAMITFCEVTREKQVFAVMDPAASASASTIVTNMQALTASENFALYWPRIKVPNPDTAVFGTGTTITIPPSGAVMGTYARIDSGSRRGPFEQAAGVEDGILFGVVDVETSTVNRKSTRDIVYPERVNPITASPPGYGVFIDGTRTGKGTGNFPSVGERRGVSYIEKILQDGLQYARHKSNDEALRSSLENTVVGELTSWTEDGAFASAEPDQAFTVDADVAGTGLNNARVRAQNKVYVRVGLATARPAEYVIILVSQDTRAIQESL